MTDQARATGAVVDFISRARWHDFPAEAVTIGKRCIIDGLGVMLAGSTQDASNILRDYVRGSDAGSDSTAFGPAAFKTGAASAALLNGTAGHALDWDDTQLATSADRIFGLLTHPTIPPLAAALAIGERQRISGKAFLEAFLTGFEVECKISEAIHPNHYKKGFHSSGTVGTFGSMAASAKLLGLDANAIEHALAITASMASGIRVNFGSMTKPLHVGRASQNGVVAAELASKGFTGGREGLDPPWGFFQVLSHGDGFDPDRIVGRLGNPHTIVWPGVSIKPYPCGVLGHPTMDAMRRLVITHDVKPEQITAIRVRAGSNILNPLRYPIARNELEAKFCPAFMVGAIALRRKAGIHEFNDEFVQSAPVQQMMAKVERVLDPEIEAKGWEKIRSTVEVDLSDGRTLVEHADERYRGGPDLPFTREELFEKFSDCASLVLATPGIEETFSMVESLESVADISELVRVLSAGASERDRPAGTRSTAGAAR
jgi:2-methylcitrate dehydratase PrpD